jgi:uncharacterized RDD family membrane protein YckC
MKCPKCSYIGFEETDRCRNCGYEFALAEQPAPDLPMRLADDPGGPLADLDLRERAAQERRRTPGASRPRVDLNRIVGGGRQDADLPLFGGAEPDDLPPLVSAPAAPRRPLAVRRQTPTAVPARRTSSEAREPAGTLHLPLPGDASLNRARATGRPGEAVPIAADPVRRVTAAVLDVVLLGGVNALTLYFTLRLCGLAVQDWRVLPILPVLAFFLIVDVGYLVAFTTAGGQTIGKMALGLKVVRSDDEPVTAGLAVTRALGAIASTVCLGLGLLPALMRDDGQALHDRLAGTRVVRVLG